MPESASTATLSIVVQEGGVDLAPNSLTLNKLVDAYTGSTTNLTGIWVDPINNTVETVTPGQQLWVGMVLSLPREVTTAVEVRLSVYDVWRGVDLSLVTSSKALFTYHPKINFYCVRRANETNQ